MTDFPSPEILLSLDRTVRAICPLIEETTSLSSTIVLSEHKLRKELVTCVLGSQVRHEMALAAAANLDYVGLLEDDWWCDPDASEFEACVCEVLSGACYPVPNPGRYRFPMSRSRQLALARNALARVPLSERLRDVEDPKQLRRNLVADVPGLGPKQASMFLRNVGCTYDLAILDTHVLRFITIQNLSPLDELRITSLAAYERIEQNLTTYGDAVGYRPGHLDWAIWVTMKAARELGLCR